MIEQCLFLSGTAVLDRNDPKCVNVHCKQMRNSAHRPSQRSCCELPHSETSSVSHKVALYAVSVPQVRNSDHSNFTRNLLVRFRQARKVRKKCCISAQSAGIYSIRQYGFIRNSKLILKCCSQLQWGTAPDCARVGSLRLCDILLGVQTDVAHQSCSPWNIVLIALLYG